MKRFLLFSSLFFAGTQGFSQAPKLYIHIVSHNEPTDNLQQPLNYAKAKNNALQLANIVDSKNVKWNLQTSDGFVMGARQDEKSTGGNIFKTLANPPYADNIEIDPRSKNFPGRNIADQWYLLDSIGANPTKTVGGFIYYVCPPNNSSLIDWWQYTDTLTGLYYGNKIKFNLLSGAGSLAPHCNDLNDFGIFKPDTTTNFYQHNSARNLWCLGTGCAPVLDSLSDEQAIIDLIQEQVQNIQSGAWPSNKFYVTRIMNNQRAYGPLFFQKITKVFDSLNQIPSTKLKWATIEETFTDFQAWQLSSGLEYSQWLCDQEVNAIAEIPKPDNYSIYPNPSNGIYSFIFKDEQNHTIQIYDCKGSLLQSNSTHSESKIDLSAMPRGLYFIRIDGTLTEKIIKD
mgnify:CR=1 FL=1